VGFSPLDERLGLGPTHLSPSLVERAVLLGTLLPFGQAQQVLRRFTKVVVSDETIRGWTIRAGRASEVLDAAALADLERQLPAAPAGPAIQQLSVDGAMVGLCDGSWAEVRTLAIGTVTARTADAALTQDLSYFSRLSDADTFGRLATVETQRRGTPTAGVVVGVVDGAPWCQGFLDLQRHDAVRILDFAHAVGYLAAAAEARYPTEPLRAQTWFSDQRRELRVGDADLVIAQLADWLEEDTDAQAGPIGAAHGYLASRRAQLRYASFRAAGYPIGSGIVESANKLIVEARLKGRGMHWARASVTPLVCLRCLVGNGRWDATWPAVWERVRQDTRAAALQRRAQRGLRVVPVIPSAPITAPAPRMDAPAPPARPKLVVNGKPTAEHPWRKHDLRSRVSA
jgi:hypothetical protein